MLFLITNTGAGDAGAFQVNNASNAGTALSAVTNGTGYAGYFETNNASNPNPALYARTNSTTGGEAGYFEGDVQVTGSVQAASFAGGGAGLTGVNAEQLDGQHASAFALSSHPHSGPDITSGTIADARLSTNVDLLNSGQTITGLKT